MVSELTMIQKDQGSEITETHRLGKVQKILSLR